MADPPVPPYRMEPFSLLDELLVERAEGSEPPRVQVVEAYGGEALAIPDVDAPPD
jgi:hypothetical protein